MLEQERQFKTISIDTFKNVATHKMKLLARLGLSTVYDLLFNLPFRYEDRTFVQPLSDLLDDQVILETPCIVVFTTLDDYPEFNTKTTTFKAQDISGTEFDITYFSCPDFVQVILRDNAWLMAYGKVTFNQYSERLTMVHPDITPISGDYFELANNLSPIYHLTRGIRQEFMRRLEGQALEVLAKHPIDELIPPELNPFQVTLTEALLLTHNPPPLKLHTNMVVEGLSSFRRICFEELVAYKLAILMLHKQQDNKLPQHIPINPEITKEFLTSLPFSPTNAQTRAFEEIMADCNKDVPMSRILNGDVGSGKTLVAALCMLQCAKAGKQAVLLAPTEILAQQHHQKICNLFAKLDINIGFLSGSLTRKERTEILNQCKNGSLQLIIGTHAVFQKGVQYHSLALVVVDEQHRFGVGERESLLEKAPLGYAANELLMTATPIPRSLRLALFNETQVSILNEMPQGRLPIVTSLLERSSYNHLVERLQYQCERGEQAFWICPFVEDQENSMITSVKARHAELQKQLPSLNIGLIHGKMSEKEKNTMMEEFAENKYQILVATVIIEVGVDVPNASIIVIEDPQTMGLSQLHQLRGRVGRGSKQSYCILLYRQEQIAGQQRPSSKSQQRHAVKTERAIGLELANTESLVINDEFSDDPMNQDVATTSQGQALEVRAKDMMDWSSDTELTKNLQEILQSHDSISLKRLKILQCTNNGFAIASQDLILRGPGEFFGQNQTGNENFKYADLIRDYRMLGKVNQVSEWIYTNRADIAKALVMRWYPNFDEMNNQKLQEQQLNKQEQSKLIAEINQGVNDSKAEEAADGSQGEIIIEASEAAESGEATITPKTADNADNANTDNADKADTAQVQSEQNGELAAKSNDEPTAESVASLDTNTPNQDKTTKKPRKKTTKTVKSSEATESTQQATATKTRAKAKTKTKATQADKSIEQDGASKAGNGEGLSAKVSAKRREGALSSIKGSLRAKDSVNSCAHHALRDKLTLQAKLTTLQAKVQKHHEQEVNPPHKRQKLLKAMLRQQARRNLSQVTRI